MTCGRFDRLIQSKSNRILLSLLSYGVAGILFLPVVSSETPPIEATVRATKRSAIFQGTPSELWSRSPSPQSVLRKRLFTANLTGLWSALDLLQPSDIRFDISSAFAFYINTQAWPHAAIVEDNLEAHRL